MEFYVEVEVLFWADIRKSRPMCAVGIFIFPSLNYFIRTLEDPRAGWREMILFRSKTGESSKNRTFR